MSTCISRHGEYGEHVPGEGSERFVCQRCFVFDEDGCLAALDTAEAALGKVRALVEELAHEAQRQSKAHNVEVAAGLWRASDLLRAALAGEPEGSRG